MNRRQFLWSLSGAGALMVTGATIESPVKFTAYHDSHEWFAERFMDILTPFVGKDPLSLKVRSDLHYQLTDFLHPLRKSGRVYSYMINCEWFPARNTYNLHALIYLHTMMFHKHFTLTVSGGTHIVNVSNTRRVS